jgi:hypothetical protein
MHRPRKVCRARRRRRQVSSIRAASPGRRVRQFRGVQRSVWRSDRGGWPHRHDNRPNLREIRSRTDRSSVFPGRSWPQKRVRAPAKSRVESDLLLLPYRRDCYLRCSLDRKRITKTLYCKDEQLGADRGGGRPLQGQELRCLSPIFPILARAGRERRILLWFTRPNQQLSPQIPGEAVCWIGGRASPSGP